MLRETFSGYKGLESRKRSLVSSIRDSVRRERLSLSESEGYPFWNVELYPEGIDYDPEGYFHDKEKANKIRMFQYSPEEIGSTTVVPASLPFVKRKLSQLLKRDLERMGMKGNYTGYFFFIRNDRYADSFPDPDGNVSVSV